ncbi:uncharacterized protein LOC124948366 isoform X2 [Vespa velutina]|uniref:uncharacterized protein LOC124948366 isoform X2 n=1 Tax=Vespa velutina TaxID=202808 RepID=UPI001FB56C28|nr:uncharacterized protein LOC124948366 isoform X2 [Vespa velutina]
MVLKKNIRKLMPITIPIFAEPPRKVTDLSEISTPNFKESQLTKNRSIGWNMQSSFYEECMHKADNIEYDDDSNSIYDADQPFSPRYPVFSFDKFSST